MMNEHLAERESAPFSERILSEKLDFACEQLYPTTGFKLELQGIAPSVLVRKELEAFSGAELNPESGATIELAYDVSEKDLVLQTLTHPFDKLGSTSLVIQRTSNQTDGLQYIAFLDFSGPKFRPAESTSDEPLLNDDIVRILEGYGIADIPHPTHDIYRLWRANLLSNCQKGWKVSEEVEMFVDMKEHSIETIKIGVDEQYEEDGIVSRTKEVSRVYNIIDDSGASGQEFVSTLIQIDDDYGRTVHLRNELAKKEIQPFIPGDPGVVLSSESENLTLDYDNFNAFKHLLDDATHYLKETREI